MNFLQNCRWQNDSLRFCSGSYLIMINENDAFLFHYFLLSFLKYYNDKHNIWDCVRRAFSTTGKVKNLYAWRLMHHDILDYLSSDISRATFNSFFFLQKNNFITEKSYTYAVTPKYNLFIFISDPKCLFACILVKCMSHFI